MIVNNSNFNLQYPQAKSVYLQLKKHKLKVIQTAYIKLLNDFFFYKLFKQNCLYGLNAIKQIMIYY